ncbi:MAG: hypothetical protein OEL89_00110 [Candidatus Peregrinibacteria bacterium]|nr:hypothetical protein [Candidatus Peregrinibacteria bacterium]
MDLEIEQISHPMNKKKIEKWKYLEVENTFFWIWYDPIDLNEKQGFYFYVTEIITWDINNKPSTFSCLFYGVAYWDGIRHLYMGDDQMNNYGYLYYPHLKDINDVLKELIKIKKIYCRE